MNATRYLRPEVIAQVSRLDLRARFIVEGFLTGLHGSPFQGFSVEFSEHRKYEQGDDLRLIDWAVFAKTDRFFIKKYDAETNLEGYLLVDTSASMAYPGAKEAAREGRLSKLDYSICLAAALGYMMVNQQDAVGFARFDNRVRSFLPARSKRSHLLRIISELAGVKPVADRTDKGLATALHDIARRVRRKGLMILLSDLLADADETLDALHHLRFRGHDIIVFHVLDWTETHFPFTGMRTLEDPETGQKLTVQPEAVRTAYLEALRELSDRYRRELAAMRSDLVQVDTSMSFDRALIQFLVDRQRRF
ncbi:MAG: DUF58 domain-containing protein [Phycisphaerae bacterium]|nr:DUF58 domain-containing protein [Phycisphaerae bacterium]